MHGVCSCRVIPCQRSALLLMELVGGTERHSECDRCVWRMSEELECLDGNSALLLLAVWVHLCMHVCGFCFFHETMNSFVFSRSTHARLNGRSPLV